MTKMSRVILALVVLASGCALDSLFSLTADIGGTPYKAIGSWDETDMEGVPTGQIYAVDIKGNIFIIGVAGSFEEKTYTIGLSGTDMFEAFATYFVASEGAMYMGQSGTITVTSKTSDRLKGTFAMTLNNPAAAGGENTLEVTNGEFDLTQVSLP